MAHVTYSGQPSSLGDRLRSLFPSVGRESGSKVAAFPAINTAQITPFSATFNEVNADSFIRYGYKQNATVFACVSALATGFSEPPLCVYGREGNKVEKHPLLDLIKRPNPIMGQDEFWQYIMVYMALTGNAYIHKVRSSGGRPMELWPYHGGQIRPIPEGNNWVARFAYRTALGQDRPIPTEDIIHIKWLVDPEAPWRGLSPIEAVARDVDTSNEVVRFLKSLVENDAVMRGLLELSPDKPMTPTAMQELKREWNKKYGGENRGTLGILPPGAKYTRMALNMQELALHEVAFMPEAHICQAFMVPPIVANAMVGLDKGTYSNYEQAVERFTNGTLLPKWKSAAAECDSSLLTEYGTERGYYCAFDITAVGALSESEDNLWERVISAYEKNVISLNEARAKLGYDEVDGGDEVLPPEPEPMPAQDAPQGAEMPQDGQDMQGMMQQSSNTGKAILGALEAKSNARKRDALERQTTRKLERVLSRHYEAIAGHVGE